MQVALLLGPKASAAVEALVLTLFDDDKGRVFEVRVDAETGSR
jgi:hypothetical protein